MKNENERNETAEASGVASSDLLALIDFWHKEAEEYDEIRRSKINETRWTSRALQLGRADAHRKCAQELRELISANTKDRQPASE